MLIPYTNHPLEDELMFSWIHRLAIANGFDGTEASAIRLFSKIYIHPNNDKGGYPEPHYDCHDEMYLFLSSLGLSFEKLPNLYLDTNIFPAVAPFMTKMRQTNYINKAVYPNDMGFTSLIFKYSNSLITNTFICPECAKEDIEKHGFFYLHRAHHLPNVKCCHKHGIALHKFIGKKPNELLSTELYEQINDCIGSAEIKYAKFYNDLLNAKINTNSMELAPVIRNKINKMGYTRPNYAKLVEKIYNSEYKSLFPQDLNKYLWNRLTGGRSYNLDFVMTPALLCYLFKDVKQLMKVLPKDNTNRHIFSENLLENNCALISKYNELLVSIKNRETGKIFMTSPHGFNIGWRDPDDIKELSEGEMFSQLVSNITNNEYEVISEFNGTAQKVLFKHNVCGREFEMPPNAFLLSEGRCICEKNVTIEKAKERLATATNGEYELLEYTKQHEQATFLHKPCGSKITKRFSAMIRFPFCEKCKKEATEKRRANAKRKELEYREANKAHDRVCPSLRCAKIHDTDFFRQQMVALTGDEYELLSDVVAVTQKVKMKHKTCGQVFEITPAAFIRGSRCNCQTLVYGEEFVKYVAETSCGEYKIKEGNKANRFIVTNTITGEVKDLVKCRIIQELHRPTESPLLPCRQRKEPFSPYKQHNTTKVLLMLKEQFKDTDIFEFTDIDTSKTDLTDLQIRAAITMLMMANKLYNYDLGFYCLSEHCPNNFEYVQNRFCIKNGARVGMLRGKSLLEYFAQNGLSDDIYVFNNDETSKTSRKEFVKDIIITIKKPKIKITDKNFAMLTILEATKIAFCDIEPYIHNVRKFIKENNVKYEDCEKLIPEISERPQHTKFNLMRLFDVFPDDYDKRAASDELTQKVFDRIKDTFINTETFTTQDVISLGFTKSQFNRCAINLIKDKKIKKMKDGLYIFN